jgi:hypothetical protein
MIYLLIPKYIHFSVIQGGANDSLSAGFPLARPLGAEKGLKN